MTAKIYLRHHYKAIRAASYKEAVETFFKLYGYVPAPVFGPVGCGDALESRYVHQGFYNCAVREEVGR